MSRQPIYTKIPQLSTQSIVLIIRGYSMGAIRDGWMAVIDNNKTRPGNQHQDQLCIARTREGRVMLRFVKKGARHNRWDLISVTGDPMIDVELEWCELVKMIIPHKMTAAEMKFINSLEAGEIVEDEHASKAA